MDVLGLIEVPGQAQLLPPAAQTRQRRLGGFLHHGAQVAGQLQLAAAVQGLGFYLQDLAAYLGPGQAIDHAHLVPVAVNGVGVLLHAQQVPEILVGDVHALHVAVYQLHSSLTAELAQLPLQHPDTGFLGIGRDDPADGVVADAQLGLFQAVLLQLLGQQVLLGDLQLFLVGIAAQLDDLHPVQQGTGDGVQGVGGGDEHHPAQVHRHLQEVIPEGMILLTVQHLQQG